MEETTTNLNGHNSSCQNSLVTLISGDGDTFQVPTYIALQSRTIKNALTSGLKESRTQQFNCPTTSSSVLSCIIKILTNLKHKKHLKNYKLIDVLVKNSLNNHENQRALYELGYHLTLLDIKQWQLALPLYKTTPQKISTHAESLYDQYHYSIPNWQQCIGIMDNQIVMKDRRGNIVLYNELGKKIKTHDTNRLFDFTRCIVSNSKIYGYDCGDPIIAEFNPISQTVAQFATGYDIMDAFIEKNILVGFSSYGDNPHVFLVDLNTQKTIQHFFIPEKEWEFKTVADNNKLIGTLWLYRLHEPQDSHIGIWDINTGNCILQFSAHDAKIHSLLLYKDTIISAAYDNTIKVWDITTGELKKMIYTPNSSVTLTAHSKLLVCSNEYDSLKKGHSKHISLYSIKTGKRILKTRLSKKLDEKEPYITDDGLYITTNHKVIFPDSCMNFTYIYDLAPFLEKKDNTAISKLFAEMLRTKAEKLHKKITLIPEFCEELKIPEDTFHLD